MTVRNPLTDLFARQPVLAAYGLLLIVCAGAGLVWQSLDPRLLGEANVWTKPTKFSFSIGVFALTAAWFFGYVRPERRRSAPMQFVIWAILIAGAFELGYITWQAARGLESHFNTATPLAAIMYSLMGVGAVMLVLTCLPLAYEIARRPAEGLRPDYRFAVVAGLVATFALGGSLGGYMSAQPGHAVGAEAGAFPVFGWNMTGGDLRVAHFFGMHMEQALPMLAAVLAGAPAFVRWSGVTLGLVFGAAVTLGTFVQALAGQPLIAAFAS